MKSGRRPVLSTKKYATTSPATLNNPTWVKQTKTQQRYIYVSHHRASVLYFLWLWGGRVLLLPCGIYSWTQEAQTDGAQFRFLNWGTMGGGVCS